VWLDRGELDKILEQMGAPARLERRPAEDRRGHQPEYRRKKSSPLEMLGDLFGG